MTTPEAILSRVEESLADLRSKVSAEVDQAKHEQERRLRRSMAVVVVAVAAVLAVLAIGIVVTVQHGTELHKIDVTRCQTHNEFVASDQAAFDELLTDVIALTPSPQGKAALAHLRAEFDASYQRRLPLFHCPAP